MMNREAYEGVTDLSDFETVMYGIEPDKYYLIATSEHPLTAMRMDEVIEPSELPIKMVGVSPASGGRSARTASRTGASGGCTSSPRSSR